MFVEKLGGVVGVIQCSKSDESYVIRWDNIMVQWGEAAVKLV